MVRMLLSDGMHLFPSMDPQASPIVILFWRGQRQVCRLEGILLDISHEARGYSAPLGVTDCSQNQMLCFWFSKLMKVLKSTSAGSVVAGCSLLCLACIFSCEVFVLSDKQHFYLELAVVSKGLNCLCFTGWRALFEESSTNRKTEKRRQRGFGLNSVSSFYCELSSKITVNPKTMLPRVISLLSCGWETLRMMKGICLDRQEWFLKSRSGGCTGLKAVSCRVAVRGRPTVCGMRRGGCWSPSVTPRHSPWQNAYSSLQLAVASCLSGAAGSWRADKWEVGSVSFLLLCWTSFCPRPALHVAKLGELRGWNLRKEIRMGVCIAAQGRRANTKVHLQRNPTNGKTKTKQLAFLELTASWGRKKKKGKKEKGNLQRDILQADSQTVEQSDMIWVEKAWGNHKDCHL